MSETLHAGGAETFVLRLARKLNRLGHHCDVLNLNPDIENEALIEAYPDLNILRADVPGLSWLRRIDRRIPRAALQARLTRRWFERHCLGRYDIYHSHLFKPDLLLAEAKRRAPGLRFVSTLHGDYQLYHDCAGEGGERIASWLEKMRLLADQCDGWAYIADRQAELLTQSYGIDRAKLHKIYNGYEPPRVSTPHERTESGGLTFVMVARGIREKGWEHLVRAFRRLRPGSRLVLVGEGPFLDELEQRHGKDPGIVFTGFHPNPIEIIQAADLFVFPSTYGAESLPTVLMESLYCRVPVISTAIGEIPVMLSAEGEVCGQLIDPAGDIVAGLTEAMQRYLDDRSLLERHRQLAGAAFAKFDMTRCAERYLDLYREVLSRRLPSA